MSKNRILIITILPQATKLASKQIIINSIKITTLIKKS